MNFYSSLIPRYSALFNLYPAFDDDFALGVELNRIHTLAVQIAEERLFLSAEGEGCRWRGDTDIDTDVTGVDAIFEITGMTTAVGENAGGVTVFAGIDDVYGLVKIGSFHDRQNRAKNFFFGEDVVGLDIFDDGRPNEHALAETFNAGITAIEHNFRALS